VLEANSSPLRSGLTAEVEGFEPPLGGLTDRCLTNLATPQSLLELRRQVSILLGGLQRPTGTAGPSHRNASCDSATRSIRSRIRQNSGLRATNPNSGEFGYKQTPKESNFAHVVQSHTGRPRPPEVCVG
jgi:hypothetical protein